MEFQKLIMERRTVRRFKQTPLTDGDIRAVLDAARQASCASNIQRLRYIVIRTPELTEKIFRLTHYAGKVKPRRDPVWGVSAPVAFIAVTVPGEGGHLEADAGAAIQSMEFAAWERGIGCCWIGSFNKAETEAILEMQDGRSVMYLVALGYRDETPVSEDIGSDGDASYYLDERDVLHVPKFSVETLAEWR